MDFNHVEFALESFAQKSSLVLATYSFQYFVISTGFVGALLILFGVSPLQSTSDTTSTEMVCLWIRKLLILCVIGLVSVIGLMFFLVLITTEIHNPFDALDVSLSYYKKLFKTQWGWCAGFIGIAIVLRFCVQRFARPKLSAFLRARQFVQETDSPSDILEEMQTYRQKNFTPSEYYQASGIFVGLDERETPDYIPMDTFHETNMQIIGPSRYGKGVLLGCLMDQIIRKGDGLVYVDPKADTFAPQILYQAAKAMNRPFHFLALHDEAKGAWAPFEGGSVREALARLEMAFGLAYTGNPGTDFYKSQEKSELETAIHKHRSIKELLDFLKGNDKTLRVNAELKRWAELASLSPEKDQGFSIEKAILENAVVYVQGSLDDPIVTSATKVFIAEYVQTTRNLHKSGSRSTHLSMVIDEVSFLASQLLAKSLATSVGFHVNFILAYQSPSDLLNIDDKTVDPRYLLQSIMINSQVKITYGGTDQEAAELVSKLSGTTIKTVTRSEATSVDLLTGGESWEPGRSVIQQEVPLIHVNTMYALPPRVCAFFQPKSLAQIRYTSHVPIEDPKALGEYLKRDERQSTSDRSAQAVSVSDVTKLCDANNNEPKPHVCKDSVRASRRSRRERQDKNKNAQD